MTLLFSIFQDETLLGTEPKIIDLRLNSNTELESGNLRLSVRSQ